ncbi:unnamed protein product [Trichobilharzia regenti]|nr:unnamed protein product [Trichobilharzia regenti]
MSTRRSTDLRRYLDKYDAEGGIPLCELKSLLGKSDLPESKLSDIVDSADADRDQRITYDEFVRQVISEDDKVLTRLRIDKRILNRAVLAVAPDCGRNHQRAVALDSGYDDIDGYNWGEADVDNYVEAYDCRPPPIFIPLITIAEVIYFSLHCQQLTVA